jgi:hypothetical protein
MQKNCYRISEAVQRCPALGSRSRVYQLINEGKLQAVKSGNKLTFITEEELQRFVASLPAWSPWLPKAKTAA